MIQTLVRRWRHFREAIADRFVAPGEPTAPAPAPPSRWRLIVFGLLGLIVFALIYYPVGMVMTHVVDDDPKFDVPKDALQAGQSHAVALAAALVRREVDVHPWVANDPFLLPGALLNRMPSFQQGLIGALGRFAFELTDQIGRVRGSSKADADLQQAAGLLQYSGTVWFFDLKVQLMPTASSESQYRRAARALDDYNQRLAHGEAVFDPRTDNLLATIDRFAADLGSTSAQLDRLIRDGSLISGEVTRAYYDTKGRTYAYFLLMRALSDDYGMVIRDRQLQSVWDQAVSSLGEAARLKPFVVINASPGSALLPNDLASLGFYVLRARTQLREISQVLQK